MMLLNRVVRAARAQPGLRYGAVRYEVAPTGDVNTTMALMLDHAFEAARVGGRMPRWTRWTAGPP